MIRTFAASLAIASSLAHPDDASHVISEHVQSFQASSGSGSLCTSYSCCNISSSEGCGLASMPKDETTLVLPGGDTRCIYSYSTPFAFQVIPGDSDKVLLYFQGGGACWDAASTKAGFCTSDSSPQSPVGVFDRENADNTYKDYTIVHVLYCSGDIHGGNVVRDYDDKDGVPVEQRGFNNGKATLDWLAGQQASGALASTLESLVVMGCSAGSIGAQLWSDTTINTLKWNKAAIIPDSYAGVFPPGSQGPLIYDYGMCSIAKGFISDENLVKCYDETLTLQDITDDFIKKNSHVPFNFIQSKVDAVQISFYISVGASMNLTAAITPAEFYADVNTIFEQYNENSNFLTYLVDGDQHCFSPYSLYYTADAVSAKDDGANTKQQMMSDWAGSFPLDESASELTVCEGDLQSTKNRGSGNDFEYCSEELFPKEYVEHY